MIRSAVGIAVLAVLSALAVVPVAASAADDPLPAECAVEATEVVCTFDVPGTSSFTVPDGVEGLTFTVEGASGGNAFGFGGTGGLVGRTTATLDAMPGQALQINIGGRGGDATQGTPGAGGFGGGATGGTSNHADYMGGGGGGASDVRIGDFALDDRILVGGGGGGASGSQSGGAGGGTTGGAGEVPPYSGGGGTQTEGGANPPNSIGQAPGQPGVFGAGGAGANDPSPVGGFLAAGGGGGGGWYGGGGAPGEATGRGGGGGSGYGPVGAVLDSGVRSGDGRVEISFDRIAQTIEFTSDAPGGAVIDDTYEPSAVASSGLPAEFSIDPESSDVCTVDGGEVLFIGVGTCVIWAEQPGDGVYFPAEPVSQDVEVDKKPQSVEFTTEPPEWLVIGDTYEPPAVASSGLPVKFSIDPSAAEVCVIDEDVVFLVAAGECVVLADQAGDDEWSAAEQVSQAFVVERMEPDIEISSPDEAEFGEPVTFEVEAFGDPLPTGTLDFFYVDLDDLDIDLDDFDLGDLDLDLDDLDLDADDLDLAAGVLSAAGLDDAAASDDEDDDEPFGTVTLDDDGRGALTVDDLPVGESFIVAEYSGDETYQPVWFIGGLTVTEVAATTTTTTTSTTVASVTSTTVSPGSLPKTGSSTSDLMVMALVLLVVGGGLIVITRRQATLERGRRSGS